MELNAAAVLQAEQIPGGGWRVWCTYCRRFHYHGARPGHRVAHCVRSTPYTVTGYVLLPPDPTSRGAA